MPESGSFQKLHDQPAAGNEGKPHIIKNNFQEYGITHQAITSESEIKDFCRDPGAEFNDALHTQTDRKFVPKSTAAKNFFLCADL